MRMQKLFIKCLIGSVFAITLLGFVIGLCNFWVERSTQKQVYSNAAIIPSNDVGLVLGTSKYTSRGFENPYFAHRIQAAVLLYKQGKIKHLLVSGDNRLKEYNEPRFMLKALIEKGIPEKDITMDFAGFRTLDSVVRSKKVFGQSRITIISQKFHNQRALFLANHRAIQAIGFNAKDVPLTSSLKTRIREPLARCKAILDILILNKQPKFLGEKVIIQVED